jgi:oxygen-independent coproporphyrinogen-3 oxidase
MSGRSLGAYVHVPFCASRCGYCDFNTYTASELERDGTSVSTVTYAERVIREIELTQANKPDFQAPLETVFFGGGTPTLLAADNLVAILQALNHSYGLAANCEVTTEANPDSVTKEYLATLRAGGFTRISFGHQSSSEKVLQILDRTHTSGRTWEAVRWAREVGFAHVSVDLIYGSPQETDEDLQLTLAEVAQADVDHVSAYSLIVEPGTRLAATIKRGELPAPSDDVAASRYQMIESALVAKGMTWYEVSNWSLPDGQCRHNLAYWRNQDWLGIGPGAHAHFNGIRQWNVKHPAAWAAKVDAGEMPVADFEQLTQADISHENIMLGLRLRTGLSLTALSDQGRVVAGQACSQGLLEPEQFEQGTAVLTYQGRLLADGLVARLWD